MLESGLGGRVCLVTGAGGGIGKATAELLSDQGARLVLVDLNEIPEPPTGALTVSADLRSRSGVDTVFGAVREHYGRLDVLIHCAGIYKVTPFPEVTEDEWSNVIDTNLRSAFLMAQGAVEMMREHGDGRIVLLGSVSARTGGLSSGGVHYVASKAAIGGLTRNVAKYAGPLGIRVNALNPGFTETSMSASLGEQAKLDAAKVASLGRVSTAAEQAAMAVVLASDLASFVHGATIDVNGGAAMPA